ncbi:hypothetical protein E2C01_094380 [Portunus trituberculatus]|uniref:Uncharacterized protein n=1 Tax=Portunus trituberculatus TaxID=210409 RepID=A0A5B7K1I0_PORTR|nr:hypothetical protein [Portunus trituberculatus]
MLVPISAGLPFFPGLAAAVDEVVKSNASSGHHFASTRRLVPASPVCLRRRVTMQTINYGTQSGTLFPCRMKGHEEIGEE